jgi:DNA/RNA-binding domain of Phe-tRNA-synthetase-like protein
MADRMTGAEAIAMRRREVPHAHRVFFRHIGLDPDVVRTPVEALVLRRMSEGGLRPQGLIADALTVAVLETGVGVWAFGGLAGVPRIEEDGGRLVLADEHGRLAVLFGEPERGAPGKATRRLALVAIAVPGVADLYVQEALWTAWDILR